MTVDPAREAEYRRLVISHWDLDEAAGFASALSRWTDRAGDGGAVAEALSLALVVAYMRPFTKNWLGDNTDRRLDVASLRLSDTDLGMHNRLAFARDKVFAHSDPLPLQLRIEDGGQLGPIPHMREPRVAFSTESAAELLAHVVLVRDRIAARLAEFGTGLMFRE